MSHNSSEEDQIRRYYTF